MDNLADDQARGTNSRMLLAMTIAFAPQNDYFKNTQLGAFMGVFKKQTKKPVSAPFQKLFSSCGNERMPLLVH